MTAPTSSSEYVASTAFPTPDVTMADIHAAIDADYRPHGTPSEIRVVNKDEIWLYYNPPDRRDIDIGHHVIKRIGGKWRYYTEVLITE